MSNVVIMVWKQHLESGFGDLLRGTIYLCKLSQQLNFKLIVDMQLHPVSKLLVPRPHMYSSYVMEHQSEIYNGISKQPEEIVNTIKTNMMHDKPFLIITNVIDNYIESPSNSCKYFMRSLLTPNDDFKKYFNDMCNAFRIPINYSIAHFRLGDEKLLDNQMNFEQYNTLCGIIDFQMASTPNLYIMSDSLHFKQYLCKRIRPELTERIIPTTPIHLAHPDADVEKMKETMFDFMLLTNARIIKTHSKYKWVSGFVQWASHIFSVPLVNMKPKMAMKLQMGTSAPTTPQHARITSTVSSSSSRSLRKMF